MKQSTWFAVVVAVLSAACAAQAVPKDWHRDIAPFRWIDDALPEDLPELKYPAYYNDLDKARAQAFAGRYKLALYTLAKVKDADAVEVALIKASALAPIGRRDEALRVLSDGKVAADPRVQVLKARILAELDRGDEGVALLKAMLEKHPQSIAGRYYLGEISELIGDLKTAKECYDWLYNEYFNKWLGKALQFEDAEEVTLLGKAFDRWATLNGAYRDNAPLHNQILDVFVTAYQEIDRAYWPARVAAAEYFLSHNNSREAVKELLAVVGQPQQPPNMQEMLQRAIEAQKGGGAAAAPAPKAPPAANPNDQRCHLLLGLIALEQWNFDEADNRIAAMRKVDRNSVAADLLECRSLLQQRVPKQAEAPVQRVLARQPRNLEALGLLAAVYALQVNDQKSKEVLAQVEKLDPDNASAYLDVAEALAAMRQYPRAAEMYQVAIDRAPWWTAARNGLGLLYTQSGDEDLARKVLDAAYALDPFNHRTTNYLILLDKLEKFDRKETDHFVIMYDAKMDPIIPEYFAEYLESIHADVCGLFRHEPAVKTFIEVFPTHDAFSVRTTGSPWIGTVGASTGRVIALCAPRKGKKTMGTFNWATVLRHEYTHTVTLSATDNRITHWMTEGLAVIEERNPMRWEWVPMLYSAVSKNELFDMDALTWAFVRPKRPQDRSLAYAQSAWVCQYIIEKWGQEAILKMMEMFKTGKGQDEVFPAVLGQGTDSFFNDFKAWTKKQVAGWGYDAATTKKYETLRKTGEEQVKARKYAEAVKTWQEIARIRPVDALPHQRLAGLYLTKEINQPEKAIDHLLSLHKVSLKDNRYAKRIARLYDQTGKADLAEKYALEAVYIDPYDLDAHKLLAAVNEKTGNKKSLERQQRVIPVLEAWLKENRPTLSDDEPVTEGAAG